MEIEQLGKLEALKKERSDYYDLSQMIFEKCFTFALPFFFSDALNDDENCQDSYKFPHFWWSVNAGESQIDK